MYQMVTNYLEFHLTQDEDVFNDPRSVMDEGS